MLQEKDNYGRSLTDRKATPIQNKCRLPSGVLYPMLWALLTMTILSAACSAPPTKKICQQDSECSSGQRCEASQCKAIDSTCQTDADCKKGKLCIKTMCQFAICQDHRDCNKDEECQGGTCEKKTREGGIETPREPKPDENTDGGTSETPSTSKDDNQPKPCRPNRDGVLDRSELTFKVGSSILFTQAGSSQSPVPIDLQGKKEKDGTTIWDLSTHYPGETKVVDELLNPKGTWYANSFPQATYASALSRSLGLLGIFQVTQDALLLQGIVSQSANLTKVVYDRPVPLFPFPLKKGKKWTAKVNGSGTFQTAIYRVEETYRFEVDAVGKAKTPQGLFNTIRLRVHLTQQQYLPVPLRRTNYSYYYLSECFGIIATVISRNYESNPLFTKAIQVKRLSP